MISFNHLNHDGDEVQVLETNLEHSSELCSCTGWAKNDPTCCCQNFIKSPPNLIIFGTQIANMIKLFEVHSFSISPNLC